MAYQPLVTFYYILFNCCQVCFFVIVFHWSLAAGVLEQFQKGRLRRRDYKADDAMDIEMQCDLLVIVSIICQFDIHRKVGTKDVISLRNFT